MRKISVFIKRPGEGVYHTNISDSLENLQKTVGGYITTAPLATDACVICDEEGLPKNLPFNCAVCGHPFYGTIVFAGIQGGEFCDFPVTTMKEFNALGLVRDLYG